VPSSNRRGGGGRTSKSLFSACGPSGDQGSQDAFPLILPRTPTRLRLKCECLNEWYHTDPRNRGGASLSIQLCVRGEAASPGGVKPGVSDLIELGPLLRRIAQNIGLRRLGGGGAPPNPTHMIRRDFLAATFQVSLSVLSPRLPPPSGKPSNISARVTL
jgi:hypothetical protein